MESPKKEVLNARAFLFRIFFILFNVREIYKQYYERDSISLEGKHYV